MIVERLMKIALLGSSWVLYLLFLLSIFSISAIVERWWFFFRHRDDLDRLEADVNRLLLAGDLEGAEGRLARSRSLEAGIVRRALSWAHGGAAAFSDALESELANKRKELDKGMTFVGTLGNNAPFIGLFGTVVGVVEAFYHLGDAGQNKAAMAGVMAGIAEALIATGVGLFVAIPAVVAYNVAQKKLGDIESNVTALGKRVTAFIKAEELDGRRIDPRGLAAESIADSAAESPADDHGRGQTLSLDNAHRAVSGGGE
jgi:biopolymer transport protein ExbB/TolQ